MRAAHESLKAGPQRLVELDALRGIAALFVALFHYAREYNVIYGHSTPLATEVYFGKYGVQLFFGISGFVILMSVERMERARDFVLARVARLYPSYWTGVLLTFMAANLFGLPGREFSADVALVNLTMFHELLRVPHVDTAYWTLTIELSFYALMLVLLAARLLRKVIPIFMVLVAVQTVAELVLEAKGMSFAAHFASRPHLQFFAIGVLAFKRSRGEVSLPVALVLAGECVAHELLVGSIAPPPVVGGVLGLFYVLSRGKLAWLNWRPLRMLGFISYPFYLVHQNIGYIIIRRLEAAAWRPEAAIAVALAFSLLLATGITHVIEQPALRLYRQWKRRATPRAQPAASLGVQ